MFFFAEDVLGCQLSQGSTDMQETFLAAGVSVNYVPLVSVLFLSARLRALQITQMKGSPQGWAQDCMYLCVLATVVQVVSCVVMPIFTNAATIVDKDGNPSYNFRPMIGAYAVAVIKYITLFFQLGGVIAISMAVLVMTPENAYMGNRPHVIPLWELGSALIVACLIILMALFLSSAKVIGLAIKFAIEMVDERILGTQVHVGQAAFSPCDGYVNISGILIQNPPSKAGHVWRSECLAAVQKLIVKVNMWKIVRSFGTEFEVTAVILQGVHVTVEKSYGTCSNVGEILDNIDRLQQEVDEQYGINRTQDKEEPWRCCDENHICGVRKDTFQMPEMPEIEVAVHHVDIEDIGAKLLIQGIGTSLKVGDLHYDDFMEILKNDDGSGRISKKQVVRELIVFILESVLKSVMANSSVLGAGLCHMASLAAKGSEVAHSTFAMARRKLARCSCEVT
jgi:hypothetical protein